MKRRLTSSAARVVAMGVLTVLGSILSGAAAPASCVGPDPDPPDVCIEICGEPVCGVDGVTYDCGAPEAECRGVDVWYEGACSECTGDEECGPGRHCSTSDGECLPSPGCPPGALCPAVCGGLCVDDPPTCESDAECGENEYCAVELCPLAPCWERDDGTWECPSCPGTCQPRPNECDTLGNECAAGEECVLEWCETVECPPYADATDCVWMDACYGRCEPAPPPPANCNDFGMDCGEGEQCVIDWCSECPGGAACLVADGCYGHCEAVPEPPPSVCLSDEECMGGYCLFSDPCALMACPEGGACWCYGECVYPTEG